MCGQPEPVCVRPVAAEPDLPSAILRSLTGADDDPAGASTCCRGTTSRIVAPRDIRVPPETTKAADARPLSFVWLEKLERAKGFEPSTPTLARLCSTPELHPLTSAAPPGLSCRRPPAALSKHHSAGRCKRLFRPSRRFTNSDPRGGRDGPHPAGRASRGWFPPARRRPGRTRTRRFPGPAAWAWGS